jgi:hypothetical protein
MIMELVEAVMARQAGFSDDGVRIIIESNVSVRGLADALRQRGLNVRTVQEIFGADPDDRVIRKVAERLGARVLSNDRGRMLGKVFRNLESSCRKGCGIPTHTHESSRPQYRRPRAELWRM